MDQWREEGCVKRERERGECEEEGKRGQRRRRLFRSLALASSAPPTTTHHRRAPPVTHAQLWQQRTLIHTDTRTHPLPSAALCSAPRSLSKTLRRLLSSLSLSVALIRPLSTNPIAQSKWPASRSRRWASPSRRASSSPKSCRPLCSPCRARRCGRFLLRARAVTPLRRRRRRRLSLARSRAPSRLLARSLSTTRPSLTSKTPPLLPSKSKQKTKQPRLPRRALRPRQRQPRLRPVLPQRQLCALRGRDAAHPARRLLRKPAPLPKGRLSAQRPQPLFPRHARRLPLV
jgi:hypothetical protein